MHNVILSPLFAEVRQTQTAVFLQARLFYETLDELFRCFFGRSDLQKLFPKAGRDACAYSNLSTNLETETCLILSKLITSSEYWWLIISTV